ncbi:collagenase-like [Chironomus tepperi]|uniref:collagenase-like n=1 Tax=Chironomus tepperi TaxID=113505 RepID=UPI00391FA1D7
MKGFIFLALIAAASAVQYDPSDFFIKELSVPENPEEFFKNYQKSLIIEKQREPRISNGFNATDGQFPYAIRASFFETTGDTFVCSGVIISERFMLTVRHCFDVELTYRVMAVVGAADRFSDDIVSRFSERFWFAPQIDGWNPDLAVCEMSEPFPFSSRIGAVRLPSRSQQGYEFAGYPFHLIGWGKIATGEMAQILQFAYFRIETNCWNNRRPTHMCSEPIDGWHVETRGGDSGGPWVIMENGVPTLIALTEGSTGSAARWWFRGTRLTSFLDFISSVSGITIRP